MSEYKLTNEILSKSKATTWDQAKSEWFLDDINFLDEATSCICGHYPIIEECVIKNSHTGEALVVGNQCVNKFLTNLDSTKIVQAIKKVKKDMEKSLNPVTIKHALKKGWINNWEKDFYIDTWRKRNLSDKQLAIRVKINKKITIHFKN